MNVPELNINTSILERINLSKNGDIVNNYAPLLNLENKETKILGDFRTKELNFDLQHPVDILIQEAYDGAVNLILNDDKNKPRLINSRFSIQENNTFLIPDHTGYKDTNIYDESTFDIDSSLKAIARNIPLLKFNGLQENAGKLLCGSYTFFFKLSDADGNETEILAESGIVLMHIGTPNDPFSMRMGILDENSNKSISFLLSNIDSGFDYVHVLFSRSSSGNALAPVTTYHKVIYDFPIYDGICDITITGNENIIGVDLSEFFVNYADIDSVKTQAILHNTLFFGNINKPIHDWEMLRRISWKIIPKYKHSSSIGCLNSDYINTDNSNSNDKCYYTDKNVYYKVGYWPDEIYRFGIVYIFDDNSLSPVFNILGIDFLKALDGNEYWKSFFLKDGSEWESEPDDFIFNKKFLLNSRGVIKFPKEYVYEDNTDGVLCPRPLYLNFDLSHIGLKSTKERNDDSFQKVLLDNNIKGFFFVRQKRIPTILSLGVVVGLTDKDRGAIPVLRNSYGSYFAQSFLDSERLLMDKGNFVDISNETHWVKNRALLCPDAEMREATYNLIFTSNDFSLHKVANLIFKFDKETGVDRLYKIRNDIETISYKTTLTNVPENTKIITNGESYFSTLSGNPLEAYKTVDVINRWKHTVPLKLTESTSLVRGLFGTYVGIGTLNEDENIDLKFGDVYNIKSKEYYDDEKKATELDFQKRFNDNEQYFAISDRMPISNSVDCYRGDCFISMFTHRIHHNFIDPELPTNTEIVDPACWSKNYGVRCTAPILSQAHSNLTDDSSGWYIDEKDAPWYSDNLMWLVYLCTGNLIGMIASLANRGYTTKDLATKFDYGADPKTNIFGLTQKEFEDYQASSDNFMYPYGYANEIVLAFEVYVGNPNIKENDRRRKKLNPKQLESLGGLNLKAIFTPDDLWELRGIASINRADVNAVGLGLWITFPICSNYNYSLRDVDYSNATELASFNRKRSFYPLSGGYNMQDPLRDSNIINAAAGISIPSKSYIALPNVPFIKLEYFTRVFNSNIDSANFFTNSFKIVLESAYRDYTKKYGCIIKLVPFNNQLVVVFEHGIGIINVTNLMSLTRNPNELLPLTVLMVNEDVGSIWGDSIIKTDFAIYGVDTVAKCIWRYSQEGFLDLSAHKVNKFLIDNIKMSEFTKTPYIGHINVKSHYNAYKRDVMFTFYNDKLVIENDEEHWIERPNWSLCYNELTLVFTTRYSWIPLESANIDNIWFSFDRELANQLKYVNNIYNFKAYLIKYFDRIPKVKNNIEPIFEDPNNKDYSSYMPYNKYIIDNAFNNTTKVHIVRNKWIEFDTPIIKRNEGQDKLYAISMYIKTPTDLRTCLTLKSKNYEDSKKVQEELAKYDGYKPWDLNMRFTESSSKFGVPYIELEPIKGSKEWQFIVVYVTSNKNFEDLTFNIYPTKEKIYLSELKVTECLDKVILDRTLDSTYNYDNKLYALQVLKKDPKDLWYLRDSSDSLKLWKHGLAGIYDNQGVIKPTNWYGKQEEFNIEFIINLNSEVQKIFNNLKIISNKAEPYKFEYEIIGEGYEWFYLKPVITWMNKKVDDKYFANLEEAYTTVLKSTYGELISKFSDFPSLFGKSSDYVIEKIPFIKVDKLGRGDIDLNPKPNNQYKENSSYTTMIEDKDLSEYRIHTEQYGNNKNKYGRVKGNMEYQEDEWNVEIRPVYFKYAYLSNGILSYSKMQETRNRDKYIKIKVRYSGEDLTLIQQIITLFELSYA